MTAHARHLRFSLRTLFVVLTMACFVLAWRGFALKWIREREAFFERLGGGSHIYCNGKPPFPLGLFGEMGRNKILLPPGSNPELIPQAKRLFPEADEIKIKESWSQTE